MGRRLVCSYTLLEKEINNCLKLKQAKDGDILATLSGFIGIPSKADATDEANTSI